MLFVFWNQLYFKELGTQFGMWGVGEPAEASSCRYPTISRASVARKYRGYCITNLYWWVFRFDTVVLDRRKICGRGRPSGCSGKLRRAATCVPSTTRILYTKCRLDDLLTDGRVVACRFSPKQKTATVVAVRDASDEARWWGSRGGGEQGRCT